MIDYGKNNIFKGITGQSVQLIEESIPMSAVNSEIILHNYPQSPVAEKARVALGIKGLSWWSVEIPRLAPKPMLTKLTGGYSELRDADRR